MTPRRRRRERRILETDPRAIPPAIAAWFAGEAPTPWEAVLPGSYERVPEWWAMWAAANPGAEPPDDSLMQLQLGQASAGPQREEGGTT